MCFLVPYNNYVLANPPSGKKSSQTFTREEGEQEKEGLLATPGFSGDQQQQATELSSAHPPDAQARGKAAVVVPDNIFFEGGRGVEEVEGLEKVETKFGK